MEEAESEPVSPTGQYFTSSVISISIIAVLESEHPIDDSQTTTLLKNVFLPISPRFSSIMVKDKNGIKHWKKVEVKLEDHVHTPIFRQGQSPEYYDNCLSDYLSKIATEQFSQRRPLWEIHIFKYPTGTAAGNIVFKLHHALGDGYSLMGALLSCLQRADNPAIPLTFPSLNPKSGMGDKTRGVCGKYLSGVIDTVQEFVWSLLKSSVVEDDRTPIRSGEEGVEFRPITISTVSFSLDRIKQVKANLHVTVNDVICGVVFLGIRVYMQAMNEKQRNAETTSLVLLNTRNIGGYKSVSEMVAPAADSSWGNQFAFLHVSVPKLDVGRDPDIHTNPLTFVLDAQKMIKRKRNSAAVVLTGKLLDTLRKWRGPEVTAKYIHRTLKNTSMTISNIMGPMERMALSNHPIKGFYFMVVGVPQSLTITMMSYMGELRMAVGTENGLIDAPKFKSCIQKAFDLIFNAAIPSPIIVT